MPIIRLGTRAQLRGSETIPQVPSGEGHQSMTQDESSAAVPNAHSQGAAGVPVADASDLRRLREVFDLALAARGRGRHPFAARVIGADGRVLAEAINHSMPPDGDPTCHAERLAVAQAAREHPVAVLRAATLYTSAEPCAMCAGAAYWCGIGRVVYGLAESGLLALTGAHPENPTLALPCREVFARGQRPTLVIGPCLEAEARVAHIGFWSPAGQEG
jgi:tRNA(Arg) A34 adenosine deaminase TadA